MELPDRLLTVQDLAKYLGVPATTLYQWRYRRERKRGPGTQAQFGVVR